MTIAPALPSPGDNYQYQNQNYQYQTQYNYNQSLMDQGGSQSYQNLYHQQPTYVQPEPIHHQQQQYQHQQPQQQMLQVPQTPTPAAQGEVWNISQNKASYVVSTSDPTAATE